MLLCPLTLPYNNASCRANTCVFFGAKTIFLLILNKSMILIIWQVLKDVILHFNKERVIILVGLFHSLP